MLHFSSQSFASCCRAPGEALNYFAKYTPCVQGVTRSSLGTRWHFQPLQSAVVEERHRSYDFFCLFKISSWHTLLPLLNKSDANSPIPHTWYFLTKGHEMGTNTSVYLEQRTKSPVCDSFHIDPCKVHHAFSWQLEWKLPSHLHKVIAIAIWTQVSLKPTALCSLH